MELTYDWKGFQRVFGSAQNAGLIQPEPGARVLAVVQRAIVVCAMAPGEDLSSYSGAPVEELLKDFAHRDVVVLDQEQSLEALSKISQTASHTLEEIHQLRKYLHPEIAHRTKGSGPRKLKKAPSGFFQDSAKGHFLLDTLSGRFGKLLPKSFGLFLRLEGQTTQDFFVLLRNGEIELFHTPDLSSMSEARWKEPEQVVKHLSQKHSVPVQGLVVSAQEWKEWSASHHPWTRVQKALANKTLRLFPNRMGLKMMIEARAKLKV